jgi:hypothetical protein
MCGDRLRSGVAKIGSPTWRLLLRTVAMAGPAVVGAKQPTMDDISSRLTARAAFRAAAPTSRRRDGQSLSVTTSRIDERSVGGFLLAAVKVMCVTLGEESEGDGRKAWLARGGRNRRTNTFAAEVYAAVRSGKLNQPFSAEAVKLACPGRSDGTYRNFFNKHRVGNPRGMTELFIRRGSNRFEIVDLR